MLRASCTVRTTPDPRYLRWRDTSDRGIPSHSQVSGGRYTRQQDGRMYARCNLHCTIYYLLPQVEGYHPEVQDTQR